MNDALKKLSELTKKFEKELPKKIVFIERQWNQLQLDFSKKKLQEFFQEVHTLHGTAGTYGFHALSHEARDLSMYLEQLLDHRNLNATHISEISHLITRMKDSIENNKAADIEAEIGTIKYLNKIAYSKTIFYIGKPLEPFHEQLKNSLEDLGFSLIFLDTVLKFQSQLHQYIPALILIEDIAFHDPNMDILKRFRKKYRVPLVCISHNDDLKTRIKTTQIDASQFLCFPLDASLLANKLIQQCIIPESGDYRILILDDSVQIANYCALILRESGMNCHILTDPEQLMSKLQDIKPNLLIMDLYLPGLSGFDLAKVIRQDERYFALPIIFISTEDDRIKQLAILNGCGGDDFLTKPVLPQNLIAAVKTRIQRAVLLNNYIIHDTLTNLLNHAYILKQLDYELLRVERSNQHLSIAMIDLDNFKEINDNYGHPFGDIVLTKIAEILSNRIRRTDFIGRYGGDEFTIIFPETNKKSAVNLCNEICEMIARQSLMIRDQAIQITVSIGVSCYSNNQSAQDLISSADKALYDAKLKGRNRVS